MNEEWEVGISVFVWGGHGGERASWVALIGQGRSARMDK
jgi:hypothetical protein